MEVSQDLNRCLALSLRCPARLRTWPPAPARAVPGGGRRDVKRPWRSCSTPLYIGPYTSAKAGRKVKFSPSQDRRRMSWIPLDLEETGPSRIPPGRVTRHALCLLSSHSNNAEIEVAFLTPNNTSRDGLATNRLRRSQPAEYGELRPCASVPVTSDREEIRCSTTSDETSTAVATASANGFASCCSTPARGPSSATVTAAGYTRPASRACCAGLSCSSRSSSTSG